MPYKFVLIKEEDDNLPQLQFESRFQNYLEKQWGILAPYYGDRVDSMGFVLTLPHYLKDADLPPQLRAQGVLALIDVIRYMGAARVAVGCQWFSEREKSWFYKYGLTFVEGESIRKRSLYPALMVLLKEGQINPASLSCSIVGAQSTEGQVWAASLAPLVGEMALCDRRPKALEAFAKRLYEETGLSVSLHQEEQQADVVIACRPKVNCSGRLFLAVNQQNKREKALTGGIYTCGETGYGELSPQEVRLLMEAYKDTVKSHLFTLWGIEIEGKARRFLGAGQVLDNLRG